MEEITTILKKEDRRLKCNRNEKYKITLLSLSLWNGELDVPCFCFVIRCVWTCIARRNLFLFLCRIVSLQYVIGIESWYQFIFFYILCMSTLLKCIKKKYEHRVQPLLFHMSLLYLLIKAAERQIECNHFDSNGAHIMYEMICKNPTETKFSSFTVTEKLVIFSMPSAILLCQ